MAKFVDLHLAPRIEDAASCRRMAELLKMSGYSAAGITVPTGAMRERITRLKSTFQDVGIEAALRIDLSSPSRMELLRVLRRFRNAYDVVAVNCLNQRVATVACRDSRVDVVSFDPRNRNVRFTHPLANLLRGNLEFNLISSLLGEAKGEVLSRVMKQAFIANEHKLKVVLSSGSTTPEMIRGPSQISALAKAVGLSGTRSLEGVSATPGSIIERSLFRRSHEFVEEGVRIVLPKAAVR